MFIQSKKRASAFLRCAVVTFALAASLRPAFGANLLIKLPGVTSIWRQSVSYTCDSIGEDIGLPAGQFTVEYINGGGNALVIVPIAGNALIFSSVSADSGATFKAQQYTWWASKSKAALYSNSINGKLQSSCVKVKR